MAAGRSTHNKQVPGQGGATEQMTNSDANGKTNGRVLRPGLRVQLITGFSCSGIEDFDTERAGTRLVRSQTQTLAIKKDSVSELETKGEYLFEGTVPLREKSLITSREVKCGV